MLKQDAPIGILLNCVALQPLEEAHTVLPLPLPLPLPPPPLPASALTFAEAPLLAAPLGFPLPRFLLLLR
jgi:hypothetical protein